MADEPRRQVPATAAETTAEHPWPVRLLALKIGGYVARMSPVWIEGQVVQLTRRPGSKTDYLTLRDADADLSLSVTAARKVLDRMPTPLAEGARVVVHAKPVFWERRGSLHLDADDIRPVGVGELLARIAHLSQVLAAEGLFEASRKRRLPFLPRVVGLVCGRGSAAERDVVDNARRRWPTVRFDVREVAVQGPTAVTAVTEALAALDAVPDVDVIVLARGGGAVEDLLPFSNEALVRAVAACRTPVVSAVGHEQDTPLVDLAADVRASTPTDAAALVVPDAAAELRSVAGARDRARAAVTARLDREWGIVTVARERPALAEPWLIVDARREDVDRYRTQARERFGRTLEASATDVRHLAARVRALSPAATLARGYAVVQGANGAVLRSPADASPGERLRLRLDGGDLAAVADPSTGDSVDSATLGSSA